MASPVGVVYYTLDGTDPMMPDGSISPSAVAYAGPLQLTVPLQVKMDRLRTLQAAQQEIQDRRNRRWVGQRVEVLPVFE